MSRHPLETTYGLTAAELLDAIGSRFRLKVAVEGAVAEFHMEKKVRALGLKFESHDLDGHPDFSIWLPGRNEVIRAECKNVRESGKAGGEAYRIGGKIAAYKVETQKTRAATGDPTSRYYGVDQFEVLGVCLGKKTGDWSDFWFARSVDLTRHAIHPHKLSVFQRVPLPGADDPRPWYASLSDLLAHYDDPPWQTPPSTRPN